MIQSNPFLQNDFYVKWSLLTPDHVEADLTLAIADAQAKVDAIAALVEDESTPLTAENSLLALDRATEELTIAWGKVNHLDSVCNNDALRKGINAMLPKVTEFYARIPLNANLWTVIKRFAATEEAQELSPEHKRLLEETMADFRESGADLPPEQKVRFEELEAKLAQLTQKFSENELDSTNAWDWVIDDKSQLEGIPENALEQVRQNALSKGHGTEENPKYRVTLHAPSWLPIMKFCKVEATRKKVWEALSKIGSEGDYDNTGLIWKILTLRHEKAGLIGKANFGDLVLERRMAKSGQRALDFVEDLFYRTKPFFDKEVSELESYKAEQTGEAGPLHPWDTAYFSEMRQKEHFDFDEEVLRPYFPIDQVINGMFALISDLLGLSISERPAVFIDAQSGEKTPTDAPEDAVEVWHPEVKFYDLKDESGAPMGSFYADWHPRESKRSGAWMDYILTGERDPGKPRTPHLGLITGNLTPSTRDKPALLTHYEVQTIFHEFGHLLHHLCGEVPVKSLNGVNVKWDFVELPSQILENWCWERESLDQFARHHETGEPIPEDVFQRMLATRNYMSATMMMRQLSFGKLDLELHLKYADPSRRPDLAEQDMDAFIRSWLDPYIFPTTLSGPTIVRRFGHLFSSATGYAAGYYSYKWAEVLEADAFSRFKQEGILNGKVGREYRRKILAKGNSDDPSKLFRSFMGREPDAEALMIRSGLVAG